jgi:transposase-like protein
MDFQGIVDTSEAVLSLGGGGMSKQRFTPEFKDEAVRQVVERGYSVADVADEASGCARLFPKR